MRAPSGSNRADLVRRRRRQQTEKRLTESSTLANRPLTPITTRAASLNAVSGVSRPASARRRYQAVSIPGVEIGLPAISFNGPQVKWRLVSFTLSLLLGAALYFVWTAPELRVRNAQIVGNDRIGADEISRALGIQDKPIFTVMPSALETRLRLSYPELESVHIRASFPNLVSVSVVERRAAILWQQNGGYTWIDDNGVAFRPRGETGSLITVQALASPTPGKTSGNDPLSPLPYISAETVAAIKILAPQVPSGSSMIFDPRYGLGWTDSRGWQVFFGSDMADMALKLQVYQSLVKMLESKGITPAFIDVQYASAPYYRMSQ